MRVPYADGTLYPIPAGEDDALLPSLLRSRTSWGPATTRPSPRRSHPATGSPSSATGRSGYAASSPRSGSGEQIVIMGRHADRIALAREFGATDVVGERGEEAVERVEEQPATAPTRCSSASERRTRCAPRSDRASAAPSARRSHYEAIPAAEPAFFGNITVGGGPAPARAYLDELLPDVLEGRIEPAASSTASSPSTRCRRLPAMNEREALKVMVNPS